MQLKFGPFLLAAAVGGLAALITVPLFSQPAPVSANDGQVERGRYLAMAGACMECHTERQGGPFDLNQQLLYAGGEEFALPFGAVYSANITPDKETGIGNATDAQIKRALREGIGIDGRKLLVMPWENTRAYSDEDLDAIIAYLRTLPAIRHQVKASTVPPPAREAFYEEVAKGAFPVGGAVAPSGADSPVRGRYLATVFACNGCHGANLAGGFPPFFAANITNDVQTGLGRWNSEQIVRAVREGIKPDGKPLPPPMPTLSAYKYINDDDMYNIIAYIRSAPTVNRPAGPPMAGPPPAAPAAPAALPRTGEDLPFGVMAGLAGLAALALGFALRQRRART